MLVKTKAIVISALKFQEKSLIVKCFTQSDGLKSYFVPYQDLTLIAGTSERVFVGANAEVLKDNFN